MRLDICHVLMEDGVTSVHAALVPLKICRARCDSVKASPVQANGSHQQQHLALYRLAIFGCHINTESVTTATYLFTATESDGAGRNNGKGTSSFNLLLRAGAERRTYG